MQSFMKIKKNSLKITYQFSKNMLEKILILNLSNQIFLKLLVTPSLNFVCYENKQIKYTTNVKIEYLNTYIFPNEKSVFVEEIGEIKPDSEKYENYPIFNF